MAMVGPDLYSVSTIDVKSDVSWILHVDNFPLLLREAFLMPGVNDPSNKLLRAQQLLGFRSDSYSVLRLVTFL